MRETEFVHARRSAAAARAASARCAARSATPTRRSSRSTSCRARPRSACSSRGMPGKLLETYRAPTTVAPLVACELSNQRLTSFLGDLIDDRQRRERRPRHLRRARRAPARVGPRRRHAAVGRQGEEVHGDQARQDGRRGQGLPRVAADLRCGEPRRAVARRRPAPACASSCSMPASNLYAIKSPRTVSPSAFQGTWTMKRPRVTDAINKDAEIESSETRRRSRSTTTQGLDPPRRHREVLRRRQQGRRSFRCSEQGDDRDRPAAELHRHARQRRRSSRSPTRRPSRSAPTPRTASRATSADRIVAVKLEGEQLTFYRTDGNAYPETVQLTKDVAPPPVAAPAAQ